MSERRLEWFEVSRQAHGAHCLYVFVLYGWDQRQLAMLRRAWLQS